MTTRASGDLGGIGETMANHPNRSRSIEARIKRMIDRHALARVEITTADGKRYTASAYPAPWSQAVNERRMALFAAAGKSDFTLAEANAIGERAVGERLCFASGETIVDAVSALEAALTEMPQ